MTNIFNNSNAEKMYQYLYNNSEYPFKPRNYRFLITDFKDVFDQRKVLDFIDELIPDVLFLGIDNNIIIFYFDELEIEFQNIISSISDDFGINFKLFISGKINYQEPNYFHIIYKAFKKYLSNKPYTYATISDLIFEIIKHDINELKQLKPVILNKIYEDSQMEKLILAMFDNNLNVTKTANEIYMHRNTVINKLDYIKSETSLNLQNFKDAACVYFLIKIK